MRKQIPIAPNEWLYRDNEDGRIFSQLVILGVNDTEWEQCTTAEKGEWERENMQITDNQQPIEDTTADVVEFGYAS